MSFDNLKAMMIELGDLDTQIKDLIFRKSELEKPIKEAMSSAGDVIAGPYSFQFRENKGRTTYDTEAMARDGIDIAAYKKVGAPFVTMSIKRMAVL